VRFYSTLIIIEFTDTVLQTDLLMKIIDSLQITIHSLAININGRNSHQSCEWSDTRKMNFLRKLPKQRGTFYFVEFEIVYPDDVGVKKKRKVANEGDVSRYLKNNRPWQSNVKRFCSRNRIGSGNWFHFPQPIRIILCIY
jgi:hypothetical protein